MEKDFDNTREIAEAIFARPPGEPNTIDLSLDEETANEAMANIAFLRDIITMITLHGVEILFGHKNIMSLNEEQIALVKRYTRSYGFDLNILIEEDRIIIKLIPVM